MKTLFKGITIFALVSMVACKVHRARARTMVASRNLRPYSRRHVSTPRFGFDSGMSGTF
jgi:hypothetical protein